MAQKIAVGIDVGTYQIKVVVASQDSREQRAKIIGTGFAQSRGIRHGYVVNRQDIAKMLQLAIREAEKSSGVAIRRAYLSVGGVGLEEFRSRAELLVSRADSEVTELDLKNIIEESERKISSRLLNRKVIHAIPLAYRLDGERLMGSPIGMKGVKLELDALFLTALEQHLNDLIAAVEDVGVSVIDVMASPLAGSFVTLTKAQKIAGVVLANIGAETLSVAVFENDVPISVKVFPMGSTDITHDIALGLKISIEDAEQAKRGALINSVTSKKQLDTIIAHRLSNIFALIEAHLKRLGKNGLLPAGVVISGGGSGVTTIEDIARVVLKIPSKKASLMVEGKSKVKNGTWAVAYGLCIWGLTNDIESSSFSTIKENASGFITWLKQFLP
ncbi:TPA: cell division protein FtsA [Patescibacteria group bacterium]|nr:MAG: Cell division protein ftsA [Parcubacteria group bacterium GW2011_GWD2_42_14]HCC04927.1 cell division protein FtsA [Patescibacteria group bacterium]